MKEKELRLALVFYGGVSLAVYQHGVNIEILSLLRASRAYHAPRWFAAKQAEDHVFPNGPATGQQYATESIYFDLLKVIGHSLDLRVVVDVISGSSAGAINGIALARAVAHDLDLAPLTTLWLEKADILQLIAPEARASAWSKWYLWPVFRPLLTRLAREGMLPGNADPEIRERLSTFVRSRWFKPPFDGPHFSTLMLDGLLAMEGTASSRSSLLPPDSKLDLMVAVTDYQGMRRTIFLHDPPMVHENEHRHILRFSATRFPDGEIASELDRGNVPSLAFAGRASASYPGAFPPARIREMDQVVAACGLPWQGRTSFLASNFALHLETDITPEDLILLDGSILNNKPILAAIQAIRTHRAYRDVDRRLIYIDPRPNQEEIRPNVRMPGFFTTLRSALSDLPRHNPIYEELEETSRFNFQVNRLKAIIQASRPQVEALIGQATQSNRLDNVTIEQLRQWRLTSTNLLAGTAIVYNAWMRSLVMESVDFIVRLIARLCNTPAASQRARWIYEVIEAWCEPAGMFPANYHISDTVAKDADLPDFGRFIVDFGVLYKRRRITFILQDINDLYSKIIDPSYCETSPEQLDLLKKEIHRCMSMLSVYDHPDFISESLAHDIRFLFCDAQGSATEDPSSFATRNYAALSRLLKELSRECRLVDANEELDTILASSLAASMGPRCRRIVLTGYLGFPYWDVVLLPTMRALGLETGSFEEVLIDRISPDDARNLDVEAGSRQLKGASAIGFAGFMSRIARENDYLWGRLHAVDRLIDILASSVRTERLDRIPDFAAFRKRAFEEVLRQESAQLSHIPDILAAVRGAVARL